jgi:nitroreductase
MVRDKETINKLSEAAQQDFVSNAKCIVVFISDPKITINAYGEKKGEIYSRQQAGAAIQNFLLKIVEAGLSTCWTGYFVEEIVKRILKIPENYNVEGIFPIGYESSKSSPKRKISLENTLFFEKYGQKKIKPDKKIYS